MPRRTTDVKKTNRKRDERQPRRAFGDTCLPACLSDDCISCSLQGPALGVQPCSPRRTQPPTFDSSAESMSGPNRSDGKERSPLYPFLHWPYMADTLIAFGCTQRERERVREARTQSTGAKLPVAAVAFPAEPAEGIGSPIAGQ